MRDLSVQPGADVSDLVNFPKGTVKDTVGAVDGTDWTEAVTGDGIQFFQKLAIDAGITENGLPDSVGNGYQLIDALVDKISRNGVKRKSSTTLANSSFTTTELDLVTFIFDVSSNFDDILSLFSCAINTTAGTGLSVSTFRLYVDGVLQYSIALEKDHDSDVDSNISFHFGGVAYTANTIVKVTGQVTGGTPNTVTVGAPSFTVEGINV